MDKSVNKSLSKPLGLKVLSLVLPVFLVPSVIVGTSSIVKAEEFKTRQLIAQSCRNINIRASNGRNRAISRGRSGSTCGYKFNFQRDGNLVLTNSSGQVLWATGTEGRGKILAIQSDGNVVIYGDRGALWATNTDGNPGAFLAIQSDGNLVVYRSDGQQALWASNTDGGQSRTRNASGDWSGSGQSQVQVSQPSQNNSQPNFNSIHYRGGNPFWNAGLAPASVNPNNNIGNYYLGNCTWYASGRSKELGRTPAKVNQLLHHAFEWRSDAEAAGIRTSRTPEVGAIAQWDAWAGGMREYGHVAVVEKVNGDGTILISESSYATGKWNFLHQERTISANTPSRYILP
jgi:surface antigen